MEFIKRGIIVFIYSAVVTAKPGQGQPAMAQIVQAREILEGATGRPTNAWMAITGQPTGTFALSVRVDTVADLIDGQAKVGASVEYAELGRASGEIWVAPAATSFQRVIGASSGDQAGSVITMTTATINGSFSDAISFGTEVMEHICSTTSSEGMLMLSEAPTVGQLTWIFSSESAEASSETDAQLQNDATYLAMYDRASDLFVPGGTQRSMAVRLT